MLNTLCRSVHFQTCTLPTAFETFDSVDGWWSSRWFSNTSFLLSLGITIVKPHFNGCYGTIQKIALGQIWVAEEILGNTKNFCFSSYFKIQGSVTNTVNEWFANSKHVFFLFYYLTFVLTNCIFQNYYNFLIRFLAWCHSISVYILIRHLNTKVHETFLYDFVNFSFLWVSVSIRVFSSFISYQCAASDVDISLHTV